MSKQTYATIDITTGIVSVVGGSFCSVSAMAILESDSKVYVIEQPGGGRLFEVNVSTGAGTPIGGGGSLGDVISMAATNTTMYGLTSTGRLVSINLTTGVATDLGFCGKFRHIIPHLSDPTLLMAVERKAPCAIWSVNPGTLAASSYYSAGIGRNLAATAITTIAMSWIDTIGFFHIYDGGTVTDLTNHYSPDVVCMCHEIGNNFGMILNA